VVAAVAAAAATTTTPVGAEKQVRDDANQTNRRKNRQHRKRTSSSPSSSSGRPYADLTASELKQLTEYHLSQNIGPSTGANGTTSVGAMSPREMHEFSRLLSAWSKIPTRQHRHGVLAAEMAEQCLRELIEERDAGNADAERVLGADLYYSVIRAWLNAGGYQELVHATLLLDLMEQTTGSGASKNSPDGEGGSAVDTPPSSSIRCYAAVLDGWCKSSSRGAEVEAEEILKRMGKGAGVRHYNNVMNRIAVGGGPDAGKEAERLLDEMIALYNEAKTDEGGSDDAAESSTTRPSSPAAESIAPNRNSFNTVIKAYANGGGRNAAEDARRILSVMEDPSSLFPGDDYMARRISPDRIGRTTALNALANGGGSAGEDEDAGERAEELLERMTAEAANRDGDGRDGPDAVAYNSVLKVWGKCGHPDAGERSEALLDKMIRLYEAGDSDVIPDDVSFNSVIHNIANSNAEDSPQRAMRLLERMERSYDSGLIKAKPDIISYNSVLNAFAKSGGPESARLAEELLDTLEAKSRKNKDSASVWDITPDVYSYNIVISAWGNCGRANKAVELLDRMTSLANKGRANVRPDATTYNTVLHAWSQSKDRNAPVKALGLLEIMLRLREGGDRSADPDVLSFSTVINAFSKSNYPRKARQTRDLLRRLKGLHERGRERMRPNVFVYAAVLNACAYTYGRREEREEALEIAVATYEELSASPDVEANHVAYGSFVRACRRLAEDDVRRDELISGAFRRCRSDGQVGEYVLRQLRAVPELYASLLRAYIIDGEVSYRDLPSSWKRNVKEGTKRKGRRPARREK